MSAYSTNVHTYSKYVDDVIFGPFPACVAENGVTCLIPLSALKCFVRCRMEDLGWVYIDSAPHNLWLRTVINKVPRIEL